MEVVDHLRKVGMQQYEKIISELEPEIRACGDIIHKNFGNVEYRNKSQLAHDAVTEFDLEIEKRLIKKLGEVDPEAPVIGEETGGSRKAHRHWLIDPIDGTLHFTRGIPFSSIMLACIEDTIPVAGIIYVAMEDNFFSAIKGQGAYKNGDRIHTSKRPFSEAVVITEINLQTGNNEALSNNVSKKTTVANLACAGYEFALLAEGKTEGRICKDPYGSDYDFAPGAILVQEAGGVVKHFDGSNYTTKNNDFIAAASKDMYGHIVKII